MTTLPQSRKMRLERVACIDDLRTLARGRLPRMVFDYIDGAAGGEVTAGRNRSALDAVPLAPTPLVDVSARTLATTLFGVEVAAPFVIGPTGLNGAFWPQGDLALARAAARSGLPFVMSSAATVTLDALRQAAGPLRWFQLYMLKDRALVQAFLQRVHAGGFNVLQLTVDTAVSGRRNRDIRNGFTLPFRWTWRNVLDCARHPAWSLAMLRTGTPTLRLFEDIAGKPPQGATISDVMQQQLSSALTWRDLDWLRERWPGHLVIKGISSAQQARQCLDAGADGVVVSNHGGRQLEGSRASIEWLAPVVEAVGERMTVLIDSGFRSGVDIGKAIALGAHGVQLGRATLYGLAAAGEHGVQQALDILKAELDRTMALCAAASVSALRGRIDRDATA
ncbi:alpha-hydroxy acid oxidase [Bordetella genomosp. 12]|uniref:Alpha-hydroxy-acid oxidizing enzyme n=1 Tax=Bordetella genomosp. 12 TaxID=463035 RepID=A0A261VAV8_9BORD|nr:alpha-hydroxy acid oxidase [Bordetella genomosp. 12]OZI71304.1 alpha-hydroxy-acid oxidizing enzyme [Bordetella genomosp. 12]